MFYCTHKCNGFPDFRLQYIIAQVQTRQSCVFQCYRVNGPKDCADAPKTIFCASRGVESKMLSSLQLFAFFQISRNRIEFSQAYNLLHTVPKIIWIFKLKPSQSRQKWMPRYMLRFWSNKYICSNHNRFSFYAVIRLYFEQCFGSRNRLKSCLEWNKIYSAKI